MPFVGKQDVLDWNATFLERGDDLLGFDHRDIGVVRAVKDHRRRSDAVEFVDRGKLVEHFALRLGIAIFDGGYGRHPRLGVLEEGFEIDDTKKIGARSEGIGVFRQAGHRHIAAIAATGDTNTLRVGDVVVDEVVHASLDILDGVHAQWAIVEVDELLAKAGGAANIRGEYADTGEQQRLVVAPKCR